MKVGQPEMPTAYKVPARSGEALIVPPRAKIPAILAARGEASWGRAEIMGVPLGEFRARVRRRAMALVEPQPGTQSGPVVVMGHQPLFFHPGVWMKFFLLSRLGADLGGVGLHLIVDSDASGAVTAQIPARTDRLIRRTETLLEVPDEVPLEAHRPPFPEEWEGFCARVRGHLATLALGEVSDRFEAFAEGGTAGRRRGRSLGEFLAHARREYEARMAPPTYGELTVSGFSDTPEFRTFVLHLLQDPPAFRRCYNANLDAHRRIHRLRSAANPFPNLGEVDGAQEMPVWALHGGRRTDLYVERAGDRVRLRTATEPIAEVPAGPEGIDALKASGVRLRPKAITLTMFARLCLGDLFIHGVGGGRYDRVTDAMIGELFGCAAPPYIVATGTLFLPLLGEEEAADDPRALERRLMDLQHNPERYLGTASAAQQRLIDEKWALIRSVEAMRPGPERRAATHRIREVNTLLSAGLVDQMARIREQLTGLSQSSSAREAAEDRGYPFFLFDPAAVDALAGA
ncbi:MAG TPA: hypothetical protein VKV57_07150 [bacterium]|nr:hypothetical protein [bacterium]